MARKRRGDDEPGEWPETEDGEENETLQAEVTSVPSLRPKTVTYMTAAGVQEVSTDPTDLDEYEGEYKQLSTGETFGLKEVENDPHGHTHHLKNVDHFWTGNADDFRKEFEKQ